MITGSSIAPDPAAQGEPVHAREHQVEDDQARHLLLEQVARVVPVAGLERSVARLPQIAHDDVANDGSSSTTRTVLTVTLFTCEAARSLTVPYGHRWFQESCNGRGPGRGYGPLDQTTTEVAPMQWRPITVAALGKARLFALAATGASATAMHTEFAAHLWDGRARDRSTSTSPRASSAGRSTSDREGPTRATNPHRSERTVRSSSECLKQRADARRSR